MQFLNSVAGICATIVHTYLRWVDFSMVVSDRQSGAI